MLALTDPDRDKRVSRPGGEVVLNECVLRALRPHAARRDLTARALALLIVEAVVDADLIDAVLDDEVAGIAAHMAAPPVSPPSPVAPPAPRRRPAPIAVDAEPEPCGRVADILAAAGPSVRAVLLGTAARYGLAVAQIVGRGRYQAAVRARHEAWWTIQQTTTLSLPDIGRRCGGYDHTTVLCGIRRHAARRGLAGPRPTLEERTDAR